MMSKHVPEVVRRALTLMASRANKWQVHRVSARFSFAIMQEGLRQSRPSLVKFAIVFLYQHSPF